VAWIDPVVVERMVLGRLLGQLADRYTVEHYTEPHTGDDDTGRGVAADRAVVRLLPLAIEPMGRQMGQAGEPDAATVALAINVRLPISRSLGSGLDGFSGEGSEGAGGAGGTGAEGGRGSVYALARCLGDVARALGEQRLADGEHVLHLERPTSRADDGGGSDQPLMASGVVTVSGVAQRVGNPGETVQEA
jgi:hypothetical protein